MTRRVLIVAPPGPTRAHLEQFFAERGTVSTIARERIVAEQQLVIEDDRVLLNDRSILEDSAAAVIVDSGYMWPLPPLDPTPEQWAMNQGRFDEFLRDERESASLFFSLMEILNDRVPICINPQAAFEHAALKPFAFEVLREAGVTMPPHLCTNDPAAVSAFAARHPGELLSVELTAPIPRAAEPSAASGWLAAEQLPALPLDRAPVLLQSLPTRRTTWVMAVAGKAVASWADDDEPTLTSVKPMPTVREEEIATIQQALSMPWATLAFRPHGASLVLSDFSPCPELGGLSEEVRDHVLESLDRLIQAPAAEQ